MHIQCIIICGVTEMTARKVSFKGTKRLLNSEPERPEPTKVRSTVWVDKGVYERFKALCEARGRSMSEVLEAAMGDILDEEGGGR